MDNKEFILHPWQVESLAKLREQLASPDAFTPSRFREEYEGVWRNDADAFVQVNGRVSMPALQSRPKTMFTPEMVRAAQLLREMPKSYTPMIWDEAHHVDELPFTSREEKPFCRSVRVWDLKGFSPAVELRNRHPLLLVADDWRRATTFDMYCMAMRTHSNFWSGMALDDVIAVKRWVEFMDDVKHLIFDDMSAPAKQYIRAVSHGNVKSLFKAAFGLDYLRLTLVRYLYPQTKDDKNATT